MCGVKNYYYFFFFVSFFFWGFSFWSCENRDTLKTILKERFGFQGWVMSDWDATHSTEKAALNGLDQEMPEGLYFG